MHLAAPLLAVLLQAPPEGLLVARLQLELPPPLSEPAPGPASAPNLAPPNPPPQPRVQFDRGAPPGAVLAGAGMALASDFAFTLMAIQGFASTWNSGGGDAGGAVFLLGGVGLLFVTPLAAVKGAAWTGLEGNELRAYWITFGVRLGALAVIGMVNQANRGTTAGDALGIAYAVTEFWLQPWVAARVLGATSTGPAPAPAALSPVSAARPVADPALAR